MGMADQSALLFGQGTDLHRRGGMALRRLRDEAQVLRRSLDRAHVLLRR